MTTVVQQPLVLVCETEMEKVEEPAQVSILVSLFPSLQGNKLDLTEKFASWIKADYLADIEE